MCGGLWPNIMGEVVWGGACVWRTVGGGGETVWGKLCGGSSVMGSCVGGAVLEKLCGELCFIHVLHL